ncbi:MAG: hypothetical protein AB7K24_32640 [Gemmataceae bacterium]
MTATSRELQAGTARYTSFQPARRRLRVYAFDPGVRAQLDNLSIGELTLDVLWEDELRLGPSGGYLEVVDFDPASDVFYAPVDLNHPFVLAEDGLAPAEGVPQFHQQMVYAVAMNTIEHFERALGRVALWAPRVVRTKEGRFVKVDYVPRLRIYPHALREANAYYSPQKKALLFGYFPTRGRGPSQVPGGMVFTCLSYDVVAHETTHALLDGMHPSFNEPTNLDVHALHEGFADIVALFQRFAHPEILEHQIAKTRGDLEQQSMLGQLAQQFGLALGLRGALRSALGSVNPETNRWQIHVPDPEEFRQAREPHERGGILLHAVFSAFLAIYKMRSADLFRIATNGTGVLREGEIHPDLVRRLAQEAAAAAETVLTMCIRGLDYCPPVDVDFGTYLRGVITADSEVFPEPQHPYRLAFIEAFQQWGIYPDRVRSLSESELRYPRLDELLPRAANNRRAGKRLSLQEATLDIFRGIPVANAQKKNGGLQSLSLDWTLESDRQSVWETMRENAKLIHAWLTRGSMREHLPAFGLTLDSKGKQSIYCDEQGRPTIEVHSVRVARRRGFRDTHVNDLVVEVRQRRRGYFDETIQKQIDSGKLQYNKIKRDFRFRRGCTLIIDPVRQQIRYAIASRGDIADDVELDRLRDFLSGREADLDNPFYGPRPPFSMDVDDEHFALLHRRHGHGPDF